MQVSIILVNDEDILIFVLPFRWTGEVSLDSISFVEGVDAHFGSLIREMDNEEKTFLIAGTDWSQTYI